MSAIKIPIVNNANSHFCGDLPVRCWGGSKIISSCDLGEDIDTIV
jgi:hypothetical protein